MRRFFLLVLAASFALVTGCTPVAHATKHDLSGWFSVRLKGSAESYPDRLTPLPIALASPPCEAIAKMVSEKKIYVLVPGFVGDNAEWKDVVRILAPGADAFMLRYVVLDSRDEIAARLATGVTRLLHCLPDHDQIIVIAHSSGGVLASIAASGIADAVGKDGHPRVTVVTVAAELAGTLNRDAAPDNQEQRSFMLDMGTAIDFYPSPAPGVRVVHLVTEAPADPHMGEKDGHKPNDPRVHVPGAHEVILNGAGHAGALVVAAQQLADGGWVKWLEAPVMK